VTPDLMQPDKLHLAEKWVLGKADSPADVAPAALTLAVLRCWRDVMSQQAPENPVPDALRRFLDEEANHA